MNAETELRQPYRARMSWREWYYGDEKPPPGTQIGDSIPVREDRATEADVEAVAKRLAERDLNVNGEEIVGPMCEGFKDEARTLLMLVLGEPSPTPRSPR